MLMMELCGAVAKLSKVSNSGSRGCYKLCSPVNKSLLADHPSVKEALCGKLSTLVLTEYYYRESYFKFMKSKLYQ